MHVVEKSWGREQVYVNTDLYCLKHLIVDAGQRCSLHRHVRKDETFFVTSGACLLEAGGELRRLVPGDMIRIFPGTAHRFGSREGCVIQEVSTHHDDADVVRLEPSGPIPAGWGKVKHGLSPESIKQLQRIREEHAGSKIVMAAGCFDMLHAGHESLLRRASALGDLLVVAINSDGSVRRQKGDSRPIVRAEERAALLRSLRWVDHVVEFDADDPRCVAEVLQPDIVVKGDDWRGRPVPEADGVTLVILPEIVPQRTTTIVERLRASTSA